MEPTQILLFVVVAVLTSLLVFVGVQVFLLLREAQKTLQKLNRILDDAGIVADTVVKPIVGVASFVEGLKGIKGIIDLLHDKATRDPGQKKIEDSRRGVSQTVIPYETYMEDLSDIDEETPRTHIETPHIHTHISALQERGRRFFHRGGKPLTS